MMWGGGAAWCSICMMKLCGMREPLTYDTCSHCSNRVSCGREAIHLGKDVIDTVHPDAYNVVVVPWSPELEMDVRLYDMHWSVREPL